MDDEQQGLFTGAEMERMGRRERRRRPKRGRQPHDQDRFHSQLPAYEIVGHLGTEVEVECSGITILVECPRKDCLKVFAVNEEEWRESREPIGRACPYCFKTSRLPQEV